MIKTITNALTGESVDKLHNHSQGILDVFTKTVENLQKVNSRLDTHTTEKETAKKKLEDDLNRMVLIKTNNEKVIAKIGKIFE